MTARKGFLGGTFDPVHAAHLVLADEAYRQLGLDGVWFLPAGQPWMRRGAPLTSKEHRLAMVELAVASDGRFHVSTLELDRPGDTFTVDTLEELQAEGPADELWFIVGADTLASMHRWKDPSRLLDLARVAVAARPGHERLDLSALAEVAPGARERVTSLRMPMMDVSGTEVRRRAAERATVSELVPEAVAAYIERHDLYGGTRAETTTATEGGA